MPPSQAHQAVRYIGLCNLNILFCNVAHAFVLYPTKFIKVRFRFISGGDLQDMVEALMSTSRQLVDPHLRHPVFICATLNVPSSNYSLIVISLVRKDLSHFVSDVLRNITYSPFDLLGHRIYRLHNSDRFSQLRKFSRVLKQRNNVFLY